MIFSCIKHVTNFYTMLDLYFMPYIIAILDYTCWK